MNCSFVRNLIALMALSGFAWVAQGQISIPEDSKNSTKRSFELLTAGSTDPVVFRDLLAQSLEELIRYEAVVLSELRKGTVRLSKGCLRSEPPKSTTDGALLSRHFLAIEQAAALIASREDALSQSSTKFELSAKRLETQHCTGLTSNLNFSFLQSQSCKQAQTLKSIVKEYRSGLEQYYKIQSERYQTYLELAQIEQQGCVRSGFTGRLLQANEVHMRESEAQSQRMLIQWDRELGSMLGSGGTAQ